MTLEKFQIKDRKPINISELEQFISDIDTQYNENSHFTIRKISLHIANILLYQESFEKQSKKQDLLNALDLDVLGEIEQQLFDKRRKLVNQYLGQKMSDIKIKSDSEYLQFFDFMKDHVDSAIIKQGVPKEMILQETKRIFLLITQDLINIIKDEYYALTHLSSLERQEVINTLLDKYPTVSKNIIHRLRHTMNNDQNMIHYVDNELVWIGQLFLENMPENYSFIEYLQRVCDIWDETIDVKTLHSQYQEYVIDAYSQEIERSLQRKENDRKGPSKKCEKDTSCDIKIVKNVSIQRYNTALQEFITHFFPEQFLLHKDLQRVYRNNKFFYKDDLLSRLHIHQLSPEMELFCEEHGIELRERQKELIQIAPNQSCDQAIETPIILQSNTIDSRLGCISGLSLENRVVEYIELFKEFEYIFSKPEEFKDTLFKLCKSQPAIEGSLKTLLRYLEHGKKEQKRDGRDYYIFELKNGYRIILPELGLIHSISDHDGYETLLKNNF